jgi:hypothetical protein
MVDLGQITKNLEGYKNPQFPKSKNSNFFVLITYTINPE